MRRAVRADRARVRARVIVRGEVVDVDDLLQGVRAAVVVAEERPLDRAEVRVHHIAQIPDDELQRVALRGVQVDVHV